VFFSIFPCSFCETILRRTFPNSYNDFPLFHENFPLTVGGVFLLCLNVVWCLMFFGGNIRKKTVEILMDFCDCIFQGDLGNLWRNI
jgi:hypothetical protein